MASTTLSERLTGHFRAFEEECSPQLPLEITQSRANRSASHVVEILRVFVSELEAESSARRNWPRANALAELFEEMGRE